MRGIEYLHPDLQTLARSFESDCKAAGLNVLITETFRTTAEQDALYAKGRTAPGSIVTNCKGNAYQSPHQWGVAFDFCRNVKGKEYDDSDGFFSKCGTVGKKQGLFWGGDFKSFVDKPHLEYASRFLPNNSTATLKATYGTPEKFKAAWGGGASPAAVAYPVLRLGSTGDPVKTLQVAMVKAGYTLATDGFFGSATDAAVRRFQKDKGLTVDGIVGQKTWAALGVTI